MLIKMPSDVNKADPRLRLKKHQEQNLKCATFRPLPKSNKLSIFQSFPCPKAPRGIGGRGGGGGGGRWGQGRMVASVLHHPSVRPSTVINISKGLLLCSNSANFNQILMSSLVR